MILEGLVTTLNADRSVNIAPMGPIVEPSMRRLVLRPFPTSTTFQNLERAGEGVFHVTDDVELLARAAIGAIDSMPPQRLADAVDGVILSDACRWYAFRVRGVDTSGERAVLEADVVDQGVQREFFGFNRAKHAVVEAAILATRVHLMPAEELCADFKRLAVMVSKTGGPQEHAAFELLRRYVEEHTRGRN